MRPGASWNESAHRADRYAAAQQQSNYPSETAVRRPLGAAVSPAPIIASTAALRRDT